MTALYNLAARKRPVNLTLNEDLVNRAKGIADNLSGVVESLLADYVARSVFRGCTSCTARYYSFVGGMALTLLGVFLL